MRACIAFCVILMALASGPARASEDEILAINAVDLPKLWTKTSGVSVGEALGRMKYRAGCAAVSYIVESTGVMSSIKVLRSWPDSGFGIATENMLKAWRFEPTAANRARQPVYTVELFLMTIPGAEMDTGSRIKKKIDPDAIAGYCAVESMQFGG